MSVHPPLYKLPLHPELSVSIRVLHSAVATFASATLLLLTGDATSVEEICLGTPRAAATPLPLPTSAAQELAASLAVVGPSARKYQAAVLMPATLPPTLTPTSSITGEMLAGKMLVFGGSLDGVGSAAGNLRLQSRFQIGRSLDSSESGAMKAVAAARPAAASVSPSEAPDLERVTAVAAVAVAAETAVEADTWEPAKLISDELWCVV